MADLAKLVVSLEAQTAKYQQGLDKANRRLRRFERTQTSALQKLGKGFNRLGGIIAASLGVVAVRGISRFVKAQLEAVDAQRKAARVLGVTQDLYAGIGLAAEISGLGVQQFDKALKRQQKSISDANDGLQTQARAFQRLGLNAEELIRLPLEDQFKAITGALGDVENATLKVAIASDIYGARNADLINLLELGEKGLDSYIDKVDELGVALTEGQTNAIEEANDSLTILGKAFTGLGNQLVARLAPSIIRAAGAITDIVSSVTGAIPVFLAWQRRIRGVRAELDTLTLRDLNAELDQLTVELDRIRGSLSFQDQIRDQAIQSGVPTFEIDLEIENLEQQEGVLLQRFEKIGQRVREIYSETTEDAIGEAVAGLGTAVDKGISEVTVSDFSGKFQQQLSQQVEQYNQILERFGTPLDRLKMKLEEIRTTQENNPLINDELVRAQAAAAVEAYQTELTDFEEVNTQAAEFVEETWAQAARNSQDALADLFFDPASEGLDGFLEQLANTLRRALANIAASKVFETLGGLFGGGGMFTGLFAGLFADGGRIPAGQFGIVGEAGPEIAYGPATIVPQGAGMGGGITVNQTVNAQGADSEVRRALPGLLEQTKRATIAELKMMQREGRA